MVIALIVPVLENFYGLSQCMLFTNELKGDKMSMQTNPHFVNTQLTAYYSLNIK